MTASVLKYGIRLRHPISDLERTVSLTEACLSISFRASTSALNSRMILAFGSSFTTAWFTILLARSALNHTAFNLLMTWYNMQCSHVTQCG